VLNGRFKGGHITRHYGNPAQDIHAVQWSCARAPIWKSSNRSATAPIWPRRRGC
jgi:N-formylglutamate amidohydrolase